MIVMKFGGSSVATAERIKQMVLIIRDRLEQKPIVVASAFRGVTDELFTLANSALKGDESLFEKIRERHHRIINELELDSNIVRDNLAELSVLLRGIGLVKELTPRTLDYVVSFGERLSTRILAAFFSKSGIPSEQYDAFDIGMITDANFGGANPLPEAETELKKHILRMTKLPVITGYIGKTKGGDITTLGRNGSDYTATIVGAAVGAKEVQIWSDVDGIMTSDPRIVQNAKLISAVSFEEASELAYYGGKSLHPHSILPAVRKNIPVRVLNTFNPSGTGTSVLEKIQGERSGVKAVAFKRNQFIVDVSSPKMLMGHGFLAKIFDCFAKFGVVINIVSTSEVAVSVTTDSPKNLDECVAELSKEFTVTIRPEMAIICIVGSGMKDTPGIAGDVFAAMKEAGINVVMISHGASKVNLTFVVENKDVETTVKSLHKRFFG